jgi:TonB family protein
MSSAEAQMHPAVARSLLVGYRLPFRRFLIASVIGHVALFGAISAATYFQLGTRIDLNQQPIKASLVRLGKPPDPKLLPRIQPEQEQQKPTEPQPPPKPQEPKAVASVPDSKGVSIAPSAKKPPEKSGADRRKQLLTALNRTSSGSKTVQNIEEIEGQLDGDPNGDSATQEGERYYGLLKAQVQRNYDVSQTIPEQERLHLRAQVIVLIGRTGEVLKVQLASSSGNALFDASVLAAVKKASPFAPPPDHLRNALQRRGIALEFRP